MGIEENKQLARDFVDAISRADIDGILDAKHRGRIDGIATKEIFVNFSAAGHAKQLGQRPGWAV